MAALTPRYLLLEDGRPTGPHSLAVLRQKAGIHVITADTLAAPENEPDKWLPLRSLPALHADLFPTRPKLTLGPRAVETVNQAYTPAPASVDEILQTNIARQRAAEGELLKPQPPRSNRRLRDYWVSLGILTLLAMTPWLFVHITLGSILLTLATIAFFALCLAWVMFFIMDRY